MKAYYLDSVIHRTLKWEEILVVINTLYSFIPQTLFLEWRTSWPVRLKMTTRNSSIWKSMRKSIALWGKKYVSSHQTDIGLSLPLSVTFSLSCALPHHWFCLFIFQVSSKEFNVYNNFVFMASPLHLGPVILVFAVNLTSVSFPMKHSRARCLCYLSDYTLFVLIFNSLANRNVSKVLFNLLISEETSKMLKNGSEKVWKIAICKQFNKGMLG